MSNQKMYLNRRRESRYHCPNDQITWMQDANSPRRPGLMHDMSFGGLAYRTDRAGGLKIGDYIQLVRRRSPGDQHNCRVVRIDKQNDGQMLIGCKRVQPVEVVAINGTDPKPKLLRYVVRPRPSLKAAA